MSSYGVVERWCGCEMGKERARDKVCGHLSNGLAGPWWTRNMGSWEEDRERPLGEGSGGRASVRDAARFVHKQMAGGSWQKRRAGRGLTCT